MTVRKNQTSIVFTNEARCKDCYRCVRVCPVKAIRMEGGQAYVDPDRCIHCGTCIRECPQGAKSYRNDISRVKALMAEGGAVAVSVAPSFAALLQEWEQRRLPSVLRMLGFSRVEETAVGAYHTAVATADHISSGQSAVCSSCPAVVNYIEKYRPDCVDALVPVASPMIAHGRILKRFHGNTLKTVFLGPCVAKKGEAEDPRHRGSIDAVLTFEELFEWMEQENISFDRCVESPFDECPGGYARLFPIEGGSLRTSGIIHDILDREVLAVSGYDKIEESLEYALRRPTPVVIEPLFCAWGCINGPAMKSRSNMYERREAVIAYAGDESANEVTPAVTSLEVSFSKNPPADTITITEDRILHILEKTGKAEKINQLNCGACGYASCRDQAMAVLRGMAEPEMCIPYMRRLAEQRTDKIIDTSPNGILILDEQLKILNMNPAFIRMFKCSRDTLGKSISVLMDPEMFEYALAGENSGILERVAEHASYNLICHQIVYRLPEDHQLAGIFVNITHTRANQKKLDDLRDQTVSQARELMESQFAMAQQIAELLGKNTAQGEKLLEKLISYARVESVASDGNRETG